MNKIKTGDTVRVIAGKSKGREGKVLAVKDGKVLVEGVNMVHPMLCSCSRDSRQESDSSWTEIRRSV